jgi:hypothetical protein
MQQAGQPLSRPYLLTWLEEQEGKPLAESEKIFCELCHDIGLEMAAPGHPYKREAN